MGEGAGVGLGFGVGLAVGAGVGVVVGSGVPLEAMVLREPEPPHPIRKMAAAMNARMQREGN